jgi:hypothetical protein
LNPHRIGRTRARSYERYIKLAIVKCLIDYAESEFTVDTAESLARARENYDTALRLLDSLKETYPDCEEFVNKLIIKVGDYTYTVSDPRDRLDDAELPRAEVDLLGIDLDNVEKDSGMSFSAKRKRAREIIFSKLSYKVARDAKGRVERMKAAKARNFEKLLSDPKITGMVRALKSPTVDATSLIRSTVSVPLVGIPTGAASPTGGPKKTRHVPGTPFEFCIPRNPMVDILKRRVEAGLLKLSNCMNIAGLKREVPAYAAPTDTSTGLPMPGVGGALQIQMASPQPTQYRYKVLIERAKQLAGMAQQMEASFLSLLEKRDQEAYSVLSAKQDLKIADANVTLQDLRLDEVEDQKLLADQQLDRVNIAFNYYDELINKGWTDAEKLAAGLMLGAGLYQAGGAVIGAVGGTIAATAVSGGAAALLGALLGAAAGGAAGFSQALSSFSSLASMVASFERRAREWEFQRDLAKQDQLIAETQITIAQDRIEVVEQEKRIAQLGAQNASDVVNFLENKFTNVELFEWMSGIVGDVYRYFLQQGTSMAKMAQLQLAFERQERETGFILNDYWTYTQTSSFFTTEEGQDRRGMTGSVRLLQDITKLDQHAFLSDQRRLQLSKTLSLAALDPVSFQQFRQSGVLPFPTTLEIFDRDFPGHFARLIKRVRCTVVAVIPPIEGIKGTLSTNGISRVVRGGDMFEEVEIRRLPDQVALTAPINATGVFELQEQPEMMLPFEGNGVATSWEFRMPKAANRIDFNKIADVLITIDYTALHSDVYRDEVIKAMDPQPSLARPFSFRHELADPWYDLHNADLDDSPMEVEFETKRQDFASNLLDLKIRDVTMYFSRKPDFTAPITAELFFAEKDRAGSMGGSGSASNGAMGISLGNAGSWTAMQGRSPIGKWTLKFPKPDEAKKWFKDKQIEDMLFVITYSGLTPDWPA